MTGKPLRGKVVQAGAIADAARRLGNIVRSEDVRRAAQDCAPPVQRLGEAVYRAWRR